MDSGLELRNVDIRQNGQTLVRLDAQIAPGQILTLMGPSGSGKSTLLSYVIGDLAPAFQGTGQVILNGRDITGLRPEARRIGILFQDPMLFPHMSVGANLAFGVPRGGTRAERRATVTRALADVALDGYGPRDPASLSGGQGARIALMRVLLSAPCAVLLDEPFSKLDSGLRAQMRQLVFDRIRTANIPGLMVTHDTEDAEAAGGPIITL